MKLNPGPGSYVHDQLIKDKMKALSYQMCHRYQQNPFGTGKSRFEYDKAEERKQVQASPDINNGMISVKDKEIMEKRLAF